MAGNENTFGTDDERLLARRVGWVRPKQTGGLRYLSGGGVAGAGANFVLTVISR